MYIAVLTQMSGCKARWVEWWFKNDARKERISLYDSSSNHRSSTKKIPESNLYSDHQGRYVMEKRTLKITFELVDPSLLFDSSKLKAAGVHIVACGNSYSPDRTVVGHTIHMVRNTRYGCEMRSHFWMYNTTEEKARIRMEHCIEDMVALADFIRKSVVKIKSANSIPDVICKVCYSDDVVKNGSRKGGQYWLCNNCGHHFLDNQALFRMKYPLNIMTRVVNDHKLGKSLNTIRKELLQEINSAPSNSTIYGWIKKLSDIAAK